MIIKITNSRGVIPIKIERFSALFGWDMQRKFIEFAASTDREFRKKFTMEVLGYCKVLNDERELPMITDALIDNHLETWQNIKFVFESILKDNGIDPETHANKSDYWTTAGQEMASAFISEATQLIVPLMRKPNHERTD
jgi:hypothetical protein